MNQSDITLSIIVLAFNEDKSLIETISKLNALLPKTQTEIIISTTDRATWQCQNTAAMLERSNENVRVYFQKEPYVAAAVLEPLPSLKGKVVVYMSADGETPPECIPEMVRMQERYNLDIVSTSRWIPGGSFNDYGKIKYLISWCAQRLCKIVYSSQLTEFTYGFRLYRKETLLQSVYKESKHPFFLESLLVPLRLGARIQEIPVEWHIRKEGESVVKISDLIGYLRPIFRIRFTDRAKLANSTK
jgi:dolichol-phosphate mannosyltransferase